MDLFQEYSPYLLTLYRHLNPYMRSANSLMYTLRSQLTPLLLPLLNRLAVFAQESPAIITLSLLLLLLVISMQILNLARRLLVFWTRIVFRIAFYGGIVVVVMLVWQRGLGRTAGDLAEWAQEIRDVWWREYRKWEGYQNHKTATAAGGGGRYGVRGGNAGTAWR